MNKPHAPMTGPELEREIDLIVERVGGLESGWVICAGRYVIKVADDAEPPARTVH